MPLTPATNFSADLVIIVDGSTRFGFGYIRTLFKYFLIEVMKKFFPAPTPLPKNISNYLGCNSLLFSNNLQGSNNRFNNVDVTGALLAQLLSFKSKLGKLGFISENSTASSSQSDS